MSRLLNHSQPLGAVLRDRFGVRHTTISSGTTVLLPPLLLLMLLLLAVTDAITLSDSCVPLCLSIAQFSRSMSFERDAITSKSNVVVAVSARHRMQTSITCNCGHIMRAKNGVYIPGAVYVGHNTRSPVKVNPFIHAATVSSTPTSQH